MNRTSLFRIARRPLAITLATLAFALTPLAHGDTPAPKIVKKVAPEFPEEASRRQITDGVLKARLTIDNQGAVTEVTILEASPPKAKIFNDAATTALKKWRFDAGGAVLTFEVKLVFQQE